MRDFRTLLLALCTALLCAIFVPGARAGAWEKTTIATFGAPVEVPGQVLPAGTYVFKLADSPSDRHIVQIWNQDQDHLIATIQAIPDYRPQPSGVPVFNFEERPGNSPMALREWFYPGDYYGQEFVYSESRPAELAAAAYTSAPAAPSSAASRATDTSLNQPPPSDENSNQSQQSTATDQSQATQSQAAPSKDQSQATQSPTTSSTSSNDSNKQLPKTASSTPFIGLIGMLSLAAALGLKQFAKRIS